MLGTVAAAGPVREGHLADPVQQIAMVDGPVADDVPTRCALLALRTIALYRRYKATACQLTTDQIFASDIAAIVRPVTRLRLRVNPAPTFTA
ncbi:hypothetical protein [Sphingomonas faeni]|uniref:hypothetical protein n=1 Tax=Sphingomonas faeni TaxID=185950 RepID=UPI0020C0064E|nr:hypothetical protein [Sphingomonas faeni]MCK8458317.1 hypothetical protein [Sphingomonas faeni]